jgi:hypothetical protein
MMKSARARFSAICISINAAFLLIGCDVTVNAGKHSYEGGGVKFEIPLERSDTTHGTYGIRYKGPRFVAETDGKTLWVDGQIYGSLNQGDVVDFYEYPVIKVNGIVREPAGT